MIIVATIKMEPAAPEHVEEPEEQELVEQEEVKVKKPRAKRVPKAKPPPVVVPAPADIPPRADAEFWRDMLITKREMEKAETRARYSNLVILK